MEMISKDKWDEDIWGVEHPDSDSKEAIPKLVFYFGQKVSTNEYTVKRNEKLTSVGSLGCGPYKGLFNSGERRHRGTEFGQAEDADRSRRYTARLLH